MPDPGLCTLGAPQTIESAAMSFCDYCRIGKGLSSHTLRAYRGDLKDFIAYAGASMIIADVERGLVRQYVETLVTGRSLNATTIRRRIATLKCFFRWLEDE